MQGAGLEPIVVHDPMTRTEHRHKNVPVMGGDRIFVLKYLPRIFDPSRFDCVVFKNPINPDENYIKRLIGLPGEQVALIHGDVFVRPATGETPRPEDWSGPGWHIARKPDRVQRAMWMEVFSSEYSPITDSSPMYWESPWIGTPGFEVGRAPVYRYSGSGVGTLRWNDAAHPILDFTPYNEDQNARLSFLVPDLRLRAGVKPDAPDVVVAAVIQSFGHEFRCEIEGTTIRLRRRPIPMPDGEGVTEPGAWTELGGGRLAHPLPEGRVSDVEFWHADQALHVLVNGEQAAYVEYDWTPRERILHATGRMLDDLLEREESYRDNFAGLSQQGQIERAQGFRRAANLFGERDEYRSSTARWEFSGAVTLHRVGLDRDIYYQAGIYSTTDTWGRAHPRASEPAMATHPDQPALLGRDQFFVCGDNSAASLDARLWAAPDPWIAATIDPTIGVVPRDLLIGKAFFVYFPAMHRGRPVPVVDFGRMRFIW